MGRYNHTCDGCVYSTFGILTDSSFSVLSLLVRLPLMASSSSSSAQWLQNRLADAFRKRSKFSVCGNGCSGDCNGCAGLERTRRFLDNAQTSHPVYRLLLQLSIALPHTHHERHTTDGDNGQDGKFERCRENDECVQDQHSHCSNQHLYNNHDRHSVRRNHSMVVLLGSGSLFPSSSADTDEHLCSAKEGQPSEKGYGSP